MHQISDWKQRARQLKTQTYALYLAYQDRRTPWYARLLAICVVGYLFSPIDLIPDFIPVLGYIDDLLLVPLGIALAIKLIPGEVLAECQAKAETAMWTEKPVNWVAAAIIIGIWLLLAIIGIRLVLSLFRL